MDDVVFSYADQTKPGFRRTLVRLIEHTTGQPKLKRLYLDHLAKPGGESFWTAAVRSLGLDVQFDQAALAAIPRTGPLVVVANHPYGVLDGIVISWLVEQVRSDFLVLTNAVLLAVPDARDYLLPVDFAPGPQARATNLKSRATARRHLDEGGAVVVFPAGGVSTAPDRWGRRPAVDAPWQPFAVQLIQRSKATVVPIYFEGQNSRLFQIASHVSLTLRLSLIFREVKNRMGTRLRVVIGHPMPFDEALGSSDRQGVADDLMRSTYALRHALDAPTRRGRLVHRVGRAVSAKLRRTPLLRPSTGLRRVGRLKLPPRFQPRPRY